MTEVRQIIDYTKINDKLILEFLEDNYPLESNGALWDDFLKVAFQDDIYLVTNATKWFYETFKDEVKFINIPGKYTRKESAKAKFLEIKKARGL